MTKIKFNKGQLAVLALYNLGGSSDLESIALEVDKLAPGTFRWVTKPEWISDGNVWDALSNVNQNKKGEERLCKVIKGKYILTEVGLDFAKKNINKIDKNLVSEKRENPEDRKKRGLALKSIQNSNPYKYLKTNRLDEINKKDLEFLFKINDYMNEKKKNEKIENLKNIFFDYSDIRDDLVKLELLLRKHWEEK